jgi:tRNA(Met) cytidine acetyltransferase
VTSNNLTFLRQTLTQHHHRVLVILSGQRHWQSAQLENLWTPLETVLSIGSKKDRLSPQDLNTTLETLESKQLIHSLGQELEGVILDASEGLSANTLGIAAGMVKGGGLFVVLTPEIKEWRAQPNPDNARFLNSPLGIEQAHPYFIDHLIQQWQAPHQQVLWLSESDTKSNSSLKIESFTQRLIDQAAISTSLKERLPTLDQQQVIQAIHRVAFGHRKRPLVVSADRGRGKSSALGLAAVHCLLDGKQEIVLTASRLDQAKMAFEHAIKAVIKAAETLDINIETKQPGLVSFRFQNQLKTFRFIAPDQLMINPTQADVLMVDEAAHLPTPLLTQLLHRHHRLVFATTLHGYEGSGRGFELRFKKTLNTFTPDWKNLHLKQPIRWAENDPLETAINQALFLTPNPLESNLVNDLKHFNKENIALQEESIHDLVNDSKLLHTIFELLVQAHYQTSPNDFQQLLSAPNLKIITAKQNHRLLGVVLCIEEGKIMPTSNRVHGHLVPQLLCKNYASGDFSLLSTWRIMRIAVHPEYQQQGIGKKLLKTVQNLARHARIDYLSSSFGASNELLPFWFNQGYTPLHVGVKRDKASGSHNIVVTLALSAMAQQALATIQRVFQAQFPHTVIEPLYFVPTQQILAVLKTFRFKTQKPQLEASAIAYESKQRQYESISGLLWEWSIRNPQTLDHASHFQQAVWGDKVLKKQSWQDVAHHNHLSGRKEVETIMQEMLTEILSDSRKTVGQRIFQADLRRT